MALFADPIPAALQPFDPVRHLLEVSSLDPRTLQFLNESNAIEDINNIDYTDAKNAIPGQGHAGVFGEALRS